MVASLAASCFDVLGFCSPLVGQLRNSVSHIIKNSNKAGWEYLIPEEEWTFFLKVLMELYKTSQHTFPRHPPTQGDNLHGKITLFVCSDASISLVVDAYLLIPQGDGSFKPNLITSKTYMGDPNRTLAVRELEAESHASTLTNDMVHEYGAMLRNFYVGVDSTIALFWTFKPDIRKKGILIENRTNNIRQSLNQAYSYLVEQHKFQGLCSEMSRETPLDNSCLLYTSPSPRDQRGSRMPSSA